MTCPDSNNEIFQCRFPLRDATRDSMNVSSLTAASAVGLFPSLGHSTRNVRLLLLEGGAFESPSYAISMPSS